jgi:nitroreductase
MIQYENFLELLKYRRTIRKFKPDPIPDDYIDKILDAARYSMSGANSQPWEFIVVKDPNIRKRIHKAYLENDAELTWNMEQQRIPEYRHPALNLPPEEKERFKKMIGGWGDAPVILAVLADPRKQWGSVLVAHGDIFHGSVLSYSMGHLSMTISLAVASLGLGSQRVDVNTQSAYREILGYPEPLKLDIIVPIGYRAYEPGPPHRLPIKDLVHTNTYNIDKYLKNEDFLKYRRKTVALAKPGYLVAIGESRG